MKRNRQTPSDDIRAEHTFDYATAVRGKYYRRLLKEGADVAVLGTCPTLTPVVNSGRQES